MLELYYFHGATCGLKARFTVSEKKILCEHKVVDRKYLLTEEYCQLNPNRVVPTLVHNGSVILESSIIMNYIDDAFDGPPLKPKEPLNIAQMSTWMKKADYTYLPALGTITYTVSMRDQILQKSENELQTYLSSIPDEARRERRRKSIELGMTSPDFAKAVCALDLMLSDMENTLSFSEWLAGPSFSLADTAIIPFLERLSELAFESMWEDGRPAVSEWWERIRTRDSYDDVLASFPNPEAHQHREKGEIAWPEIEALLTKQ